MSNVPARTEFSGILDPVTGQAFDVADYLRHEAVISAFLLYARASGVPSILVRAEKTVARARARRKQAAQTAC